MNDIDVDFLRESVGIDRTDLQQEFSVVAGHMARWTELYAEAQRGVAEAKLGLEMTEARLSLAHRERLKAQVAAGELKVARGITEAMVREQVVLDRVYYGARLAMIEAEASEAQLNGIVKAVASKRDMLVSLGAHVRAEMQMDPVIRQQIAAHMSNRSTP